jgi:hypothetical protein
VKRAWTASLLVAGLLLLPRVAEAQQYLIGVSGEIADGVEMGTSVPFKAARVRARLGADLRVDEFPNDIFAVAILADMFPRTGFGLDARYAHMLGKHVEVDIGAIGYLAPSTLFGPSADLKYHVSLSSSAELIVGPEVNVFVLGGDLPDGTVFVQTLLQAGVHANF